jgi:large subunit ribosomal protein L17
MRHRKAGRKLGRTSSHREAMFRNMVTSLFEHDRIVTTTPKAKEARRIADKMITLAKKGDLHARRQALSYIRSKDVVAKLFEVTRLQFVDRNGGYTRIIQTGVRHGDAAPMAILELVGYQENIVLQSDN